MRKKYKTKFPVARIKKIMQMDEDVGKVAQATPILISKALELFMQSLIDEACLETRAKNAKRLTAAHLKKTILDKDQFDFLRDIVENVADPQGGGSNSGAGAGAEEGGSSSSNGSSKKDVKMEDAGMAEADFAGAVAAARRKKAKPAVKDEDEDYDN
ncbi:Dr1-associated corepressor [Entomortierella parvispora]|uniref:Dr1-associated corepressor n=1 Tax=Entomortierella parvispora TaxID=205924 RepID=A0A9P3M1F4_9FUNG|nr:Dr1-associated corepressor [Entomortierella parvispora]